jgi:hypothetical protein
VKHEVVKSHCFKAAGHHHLNHQDVSISSFARKSGWFSVVHLALVTALIAGGANVSRGQPSPVAHYTFDGGNADDSSGNNLHGTLVGNAQIVDNAARPSAPDGNKVLSLDGVDLNANSSYVDLGTPALLNFSGGNATLAAWVFIDVTKSHHSVFSQGEWKRAVGLTIKGDTSPVNQLWAAGTSSGASQRSDGTVPVAQWMHLAATWTLVDGNTQIAFYTNGVATGFVEGGSLMTGTLQSPVNGSAIGREWRDATVANIRWIFDGLIDDVRLYNTALTASEIYSLYLGTNAPPQILVGSPAHGTASYLTNGGIQFMATTTAPNSISPANIKLFLNEVNVSGALNIGGGVTQRSVSYNVTLQVNQFYTARAEATDDAGRSATNIWTFDTAVAVPQPPGIQLDLTTLGTARQSGDPAVPSPAAAAIDGNVATFSETPDLPNSFWEVELRRPYAISRIELVPPSGPGYAGVANNLVLRVFDLRDRTLFQATITGGGLWVTNLPVPVNGRIIRFALENGQANGAGDYRVALGEVKVFGDPSPAYGPVTANAAADVFQSSTSGTLSAAKAVDGNPATYSETQNLTNSYWLMTFDSVRPVQRVEIVNRADASAARLQGLTLRILDDASNSVASTTVANPGAGNNWVYLPPPVTTGRYLKIGLEGGVTNGAGDRVVSLAEVNVFSGTNYAMGVDSYMTRSTDSLLPVANVNDGNYNTYVQVHQSTVDGYFEVDLGQPHALYSVRAVSSDGMQSRTAHATASVFDAAHNLIFSQHLAGSNEVFDVDLPGPVNARFVRIGLENKERTSPTGGTEWVFGLKELQAFGRSTNEVGLLSFTATATQILAGASTQLNWQEEDLYQLLLYPGLSSVGSNTAPSGVGSRSVSPSVSTEYFLVGSNYSGNFVRALTIQVNGQSLPARLSEVVASSKYSLRDGDKNYPDWVELHNPNNTAFDLSGYYLSDNPALPTKWVFPAGAVIAPHGYLIVFASDSNTSPDPAGFLHANFSLNADGESVVLTAPNGTTTIDSVTFPAQMEDLAYGRTLDSQWKFLEPTPGAANVATSYEGWLLPVDFSHKRGWHTNAFSLFITNANASSQVFWATNGVEPTNLYSAPLSIANTTGVRATVKRDGYKSPRTKTHTFLFLDGVLASSVMSTTYTQDPAYTNRLRTGLREIPTISINVPSAPNVANAERPEREASVEFFLPDGSDVQENCGVAHFGGAFGTGTGNPYAKKSYQLKFRKEFGAAKLNLPLFAGFDHGFLAQDSFDELDLHGGNHDMTSRGFYLSHRFAADTMLDMGSLNPHGRFVHLYLNGVYWGQYDAHERLTDSFLSEYLGGAKEDYLSVKGNDNGPSGAFILGVPDPEPPGRAPWETMRANRNSYVAVRDALDVPNLIDFMLVWNWGNAENEYRAAGARVAFAGGGFKFWLADADGHLRNQSGVSSALTRNGTAVTGPGLIFGALLAEGHPDFKTLLADRIYRHFFNTGAMSPAANEARMNLRMNEITNSLVAECARWGSLGGRTPVNWQSDAQYARDNFFPFRTANLFTYVRNAGWYPTNDVPTLNQYGGSVTNGFPLTITASGPGTIYYTLNGTDPRLAGGGLSPSALVWSGGTLNLTSNTIVKVRLLNGSEWSALADATFLLAPLRQPTVGELLLTEIHYNPIGVDDYEFVELHNIGTNLLDLTNVRLADGVDFLFPNNFRLAPGAFVLVVENVAAFDVRYRTNTSPYYHPGLVVAGAWSGALNNGGETLTLLASNNTPLVSVAYEASGSWPGRADDKGGSLEMRSPAAMVSTNVATLNANLARGANWRSSVLYHGSPGRLDTAPRAIVISEVVSHTDIGVDWIELQNTSGATVTLSNHFLSDNYAQPFRYAFAANTTIAANSFLIRDANQLGFGFSELGSDIVLVEASGTNILRFADTTDIPAAEQEEPFGRYTRSDGVVDFTELRAKTQSVTNALPRIGPVVFSEIMYNPTNGKVEYVELVNLTHTNVLLYDPLCPTNRWELSDAVDFLFPSNQVLAPGAVAIVCATNAATFRAQYGVSTNIPVYGPWTGALNNAGETIRLRRPGVPEPGGFVPYYRVDRVRYEPLSPWPVAADGGGASLERVTLEGYGNDPANWQASVTGGTPGVFTGNRQPNLSVDGNPTVTEGDAVFSSVQGSDLDEPWQSVTLSAQNLPTGSVFDSETGEFSWSTTEADGPGAYAVKFIVTDSGLNSLTRTQIVTIIVLESNRPPTLQFVGNLTYPALSPLMLDLVASDPDFPTQTLTYSAIGLPSGLSLNSNTGRINGSAQAQGVYPVSVSVSDNQSPSLGANRNFTLTISEPFRVVATSMGNPPQFAFPTIAGQTYDIQYSYQLSPPNWQLLQHIASAAGGSQNIPVLPNTTNTQCFLRVLWIR